MPASLSNKRVAILAADGVEEAELLEPKRALNEAGAETTIISMQPGQIRAWKEKDWGQEVSVDATFDQCDPKDFDALLLPGGVMNPDKLRINPSAVHFARSFMEAGKPIGAICHGPWLLIEAGGIDGKQMTSWPSLKSDLKNAGANWVDEEVVVDNGLVTSRKPSDIPAFNQKLIEEIGEGQHSPREV